MAFPRSDRLHEPENCTDGLLSLRQAIPGPVAQDEGPLKRLHSPQVDGHQLRIIMEIWWKYDENMMEIWWKHGFQDSSSLFLRPQSLDIILEHMDLGWHNCHYSLWSSKHIVLLGWSSGKVETVLVVSGIHPSNPQNTQTSKCVAMIHPRKNSILMLSRSNHGIFHCLLCFLDVLKGSPQKNIFPIYFPNNGSSVGKKNITITLNKFMGYSPRNILYMIGVFYCNSGSWDSNIPCCLDLWSHPSAVPKFPIKAPGPWACGQTFLHTYPSKPWERWRNLRRAACTINGYTLW